MGDLLKKNQINVFHESPQSTNRWNCQTKMLTLSSFWIEAQFAAPIFCKKNKVLSENCSEDLMVLMGEGKYEFSLPGLFHDWRVQKLPYSRWIDFQFRFLLGFYFMLLYSCGLKFCLTFFGELRKIVSKSKLLHIGLNFSTCSSTSVNGSTKTTELSRIISSTGQS